MDKDLGYTRNILQRLWRKQDRDWREQVLPTNRAQEAHKKLLDQGYSGLTQRQLDTLLRAKSGTDREPFRNVRHRFIFLPPVPRDEGFVPLLYLPGDFRAWSKEASLRLVLWRWYHPQGDQGKPQMVSIGLRFEAPHKAGDGGANGTDPGRHEYYHVQLTKNFEGILQNCPQWLPDSLPTLPITAQCPVSMLLCLLLSLYGRREFPDLIKEVPKEYTKPFRAILDS